MLYIKENKHLLENRSVVERLWTDFDKQRYKKALM